ncbi:hypothetical protein H2200_005585 [Cladophialophora chaetospira]|uniref:Cytochrome P450 monooxygenase n=1 Tax=Cladophialophora chaetospira TaxID=386627 RepID=A0AA38XC96_9EURO|nr:hypothetical protein H2200_005585 [Cladophialophora chaetospira]
METEPAAITTLAASVEVGFNSPLPVQHHWVLRQLPHLGGAVRIKNNMTRREISKSLARMPDDDEKAQSSARTALDNMLYRERLTAKKNGHKPNFYASYIFDEMLAYVIAGHDTTSNTLTWGLIYLADNQQPQAQLRDQLRAVFTAAIAEKRQPTVQEIIKAQAPYLDATIEEILRCSVVLPNVTREALVDTTILGYHIPKGTLVMCLSNGPSFFSPGIPVNDELRSPSSKAAPESSLGSWSPEDMHLFKPERWLEESDESEIIFNPRRGPMNSFGGGPRGCFGKRLAYLELRVVIALLFFNFKLHSVPPNMRSDKRVEHITVEPAECLVNLEDAPLWVSTT